MKTFYKILPYLLMLVMGFFTHKYFVESQDLKQLQESWEEREHKYIEDQHRLTFENDGMKDVIDIIQEDRIALDAELDSIKKLRKDEKPPTPYKPVGDDDLLDSIKYYARK